jgi:dipeptide/tripeptide permease
MEAVEKKEELSLTEQIKILFGASRAFWLINLVNFGDGIAYFGILTLLTMFLNTRVGMTDEMTGYSVSLFTGFVTFFMFGGGTISDKLGVRNALTFSLMFLLAGRIATTLSSQSPMPFATAWIGLLFMAFGSGVLQPALYAGTKEYTDQRTATIGYSLLYAIMNLGICFGEFVSPMIRTDEEFNIFWLFKIKGFNLGFEGVFWGCTILTGLLVAAHMFLFTRRVEETQRMVATGETPAENGEKNASAAGASAASAEPSFWTSPFFFKILGAAVVYWVVFAFTGFRFMNALAVFMCMFAPLLMLKTLDHRFVFFIFILLPVRTLFAHQFLTLPHYVFRCFPAEVAARFEWISIINPLIIVIFVPLIAALTRKANIVNMMIAGTAISALTTFILVPGPHLGTLIAYVVLFSLGEAFWSSRFLEYVANLAPVGKVGAYMGLAGIPWFLAKSTTGFYSGFLLNKFVAEPWTTESVLAQFGVSGIFSHGFTEFLPVETIDLVLRGFAQHDSSTLWLIYGFIACVSPIGLILGRNWVEAQNQKAAEARAAG